MPAPPLSPGAVLAQRYDVLRLIGDGGMGYVYETHDRSLAVKGAVKIMKGSSRDADGRARFRSEVVLARKVRHKNVCAIHD
ncbi:MAG TPA: protein kinase, partial [Vicinamibacteria bacterium]